MDKKQRSEKPAETRRTSGSPEPRERSEGRVPPARPSERPTRLAEGPARPDSEVDGLTTSIPEDTHDARFGQRITRDDGDNDDKGELK